VERARGAHHRLGNGLRAGTIDAPRGEEEDVTTAVSAAGGCVDIHSEARGAGEANHAQSVRPGLGSFAELAGAPREAIHTHLQVKRSRLGLPASG
jgi:hypothetical protein